MCVLCDDSMAPGLMHILFVHSDGFVIKEFHFPLPPEEKKRKREVGREGWGFAGGVGLPQTLRGYPRWSLMFYTFSRRKVDREIQTHTPTLIPACRAVPRPCMAPGRNSSMLALEAPRRFEAKQV